ncbi:MAG: AraC family transcriptional regulator ligand-binding domain-containing protein [Rhodocyclaceae bacterium]|nr:AraC family transcriptional regulator ligand-binding domain-containing protein [Rhodocyclaceae bacterium]
MSHPAPNKSPRAVPADFPLALLRDIAAIGEDPAAILARLRLPFTVDDLGGGRVRLISDEHFMAIYRTCVTLLSNHANRERNLPPMSKDEVDMLCYCVINCETLEAVIQRAVRFCAMLGGRAAELSLEIQDQDAIFHMDTLRLPRSTSGLLADLTGLSFYHRLFSWLIGETLTIAGYAVTYEHRGNTETLLRLFHHPILYQQRGNHFRFPASYLAKPVVRSYQRLLELLRLFPFDLMRDPSGEFRFAETIEHLINTQLARGEPVPTVAQLASAFNISSATFRRRLADESVSLRDIKEGCRHRLATELLAPGSRLKIAEVANRLGFGDARAFRRAFVQWAGRSPDAYRAELAQAKPRTGSTGALAASTSDAPRQRSNHMPSPVIPATSRGSSSKRYP